MAGLIPPVSIYIGSMGGEYSHRDCISPSPRLNVWQACKHNSGRDKAIDKAQLTPVQVETIKGLGHKIELKNWDKN